LVELAGQSRLLAACSTRVAEGMQIQTNTERLQRYRRTIVELLFAERNHVCSVCVSNGHCELQYHAQTCGVDHVRVPYRQASYRVDSSHEMFRLDHDRCILCTRCVRVCDEIEGAHTWDVMGRGSDCRVITDMAQPWGESETCTSCGKCVQVCPTGALVRQGTSVGEMVKDQRFLPILARRRHAQ
jgi:bidirectional [NiFe] hydrogenase diaphorase subunit